jgi:hypothetical protein
VTKQLGRDWKLALYLRPHRYGVAIRGLELQQPDDPEISGIKGSLAIAAIRPGPSQPGWEWEKLQLPAVQRSAVRAIDAVFSRPDDDDVRLMAMLMGFAPGAIRRRHRGPFSDRAQRRLELAVIAAAYAEAVHHSSRPYSRVREMIKDYKICGTQQGRRFAENTLRHRVHTARLERLLSAAEGEGRAGGKLTEAARRLLDESGFSADWYATSDSY